MLSGPAESAQAKGRQGARALDRRRRRRKRRRYNGAHGLQGSSPLKSSPMPGEFLATGCGGHIEIRAGKYDALEAAHARGFHG